MSEPLRWVGFAAGVVLVIATWRSIIITIILPRLIASYITFVIWRSVHLSFRLIADRLPRYESKDRLLALLGPISMLSELVGWMLLFLLGYALMFWPLIAGGLDEALKLAGSSLFTLGVASDPHAGPVGLEFLAAATGMIVVALLIGYLPTIYSAYNRREMLVTALSIRSGVPAWGPEILVRHHLASATPTLPALFAAWELWAADIMESHSSYPWLLVFRSPSPLHAWAISLLGVLDAAAIYLAVAPRQAPPEARQCLRAGFMTLRTLARMAGHQADEDPQPDAPLALTFDQFAEGVEQLRHVGFPVERPAEAAWRDFRGWRVNYESAAYALADFLVAVPAPWSGARRAMADQETYDPLLRRPPHRTPDDPEGLAARAELPEPLLTPDR